MKKRPQRKKRRTVPVPIASMGDIAFLLIIFFLVCSEVSKDRTDLVLELPTSREVEEFEGQLAARISMDEEASIYFDGVLVDGVKDVEWGVRALLNNTESDDQRRVQFKADANLVKEQFEPVLKAIIAGGGILEAVGEKIED